MDEHLHTLGDLIPEVVRTLSGRTLEEPSGRDATAYRAALERTRQPAQLPAARHLRIYPKPRGPRG